MVRSGSGFDKGKDSATPENIRFDKVLAGKVGLNLLPEAFSVRAVSRGVPDPFDAALPVPVEEAHRKFTKVFRDDRCECDEEGAVLPVADVAERRDRKSVV